MNVRFSALFCTTTIATLLMLSATGCSQQSADGKTSSAANTPVDFDASQYMLAEEPEGAVGVTTARQEARDGEDIVLLGRIGGSKRPWIEGRAAFMVIDAAMMVVDDGEESGTGQVCLDDCCASLRAECTTLVKFVDESGKVLPVDARELLQADVDELVVIRGRVQRDEDEGTFVVVADGFHVRR